MEKVLWPRTLIEALISEWRQHENLYNKNHEQYMNKRARIDSVNEIFIELKKLCKQLTRDDVKKKMQLLRIQYMKEYNLVQISKQKASKKADFYTPKLWCYDQLNFLEDNVTLKEDPDEGAESADGNAPEPVSLAQRIITDMPIAALRKEIQSMKSIISARGDNKFAWLGKQVTFEMNKIRDEKLQQETAWAIQTLLRESFLKDQKAQQKVENKREILMPQPQPQYQPAQQHHQQQPEHHRQIQTQQQQHILQNNTTISPGRIIKISPTTSKSFVLPKISSSSGGYILQTITPLNNSINHATMHGDDPLCEDEESLEADLEDFITFENESNSE